MKKYISHLQVVFVLMLAISSNFLYGQTTALIDYKLYTSKDHPFLIPSLPSGSEFNLLIKTGHPIYISISGIDKGTGDYYKGTAPSRTITGDTVLIGVGYVGHWLVNFKSNGISKTLLLNTNYQADLQDQTIGSATYGDYPDFIWVNSGESAVVSCGPNMKAYRWYNYDGSLISQGYTDSTKLFYAGKYICKPSDGSGMVPDGITYDTISILEKPIYNKVEKVISFPTTTEGITYKLYKVSTINEIDTVWIECERFIGDNSAKQISLTDGIYKLSATCNAKTQYYPYGYFVVDQTTLIKSNSNVSLAFKLNGKYLEFNSEVNICFYNLQGQKLKSTRGFTFIIDNQIGFFRAVDRYGSVIYGKYLNNI